MTIFGVEWEELALNHVEEFLAGAGREALTWEAKGTNLRREHITKQVCGFANAVDQGFLLLGLEFRDDEWQATGLDFPGGDPPVWVSNVVRETLRPRPTIDVQSWDVGDGKHVAVVRIDPVAEPPCMTTGGQVYERVTGETISVGDPTDLRALYERGSTASSRAEHAALRAMESIDQGVGGWLGAFLRLPLAVAPIGRAPDIASRAFALGVEQRIQQAVDALPREPLYPERGLGQLRGSTVRVSQDADSSRPTLILSSLGGSESHGMEALRDC